MSRPPLPVLQGQGQPYAYTHPSTPDAYPYAPGPSSSGAVKAISPLAPYNPFTDPPRIYQQPTYGSVPLPLPPPSPSFRYTHGSYGADDGAGPSRSAYSPRERLGYPPYSSGSALLPPEKSRPGYSPRSSAHPLSSRPTSQYAPPSLGPPPFFPPPASTPGYPQHRPTAQSYHSGSTITSISPRKPTNAVGKGSAHHRRRSFVRPSTAISQPSPKPDLSQLEHDGDGSSGDEGDGVGDDQQKLELKREKNRLKQRNLRMRRAKHVEELESTLEDLKTQQAAIQAKHDEIQRRETDLRKYVASLEEVLRRHGLEVELNAVRTAWKCLIPEGGLGIGAKRAWASGGSGHDADIERQDIGVGARKKRKTGMGELDAEEEERTGAGNDEVGSSRSAAPKSNAAALKWTTYCPATAANPYLHTHGSTIIDLTDPYPVPPAPTQRPRTSSSAFPPDLLEIDSDLLSTTSPRSLRIEDLLSPSFMADKITPPVPLSAYTIETPTPMPSGALSIPRAPGEASAPTPTSRDITSVAMAVQLSSESLGSRASGESGANAAVNDVELYLDGVYPGMCMRAGGGGSGVGTPISYPFTYPLPLPGPFAADSPGTLAPSPLHPSIHTARTLLRALLASQPSIPISHCALPPLTPAHQTILLNAIYNLTTPSFRDLVNIAQIKNLPPLIVKTLVGYSHLSTADLRVILMPIAILRGRIVGFIEEGLPFDITAFITHVLADARVFGDTADPDSWEMSDTFWDVWGGWFKAGRTVCRSLMKWRRRYGNTGANVIEILLGLEAENSRMKELIGRPEGWKRAEVVPLSPGMLESV